MDNEIDPVEMNSHLTVILHALRLPDYHKVKSYPNERFGGTRSSMTCTFSGGIIYANI